MEADRAVFGDLVRGTCTIAELFPRFIETRRELGRSERTIRDYEGDFRRYLKGALAQKRKDVARADIADMHRKMSRRPVRANRTLTMLEQGERPDESNPCKRVRKYPEVARSLYFG